MSTLAGMKQMMLDGPDDHIADFVKETVKEWDDEPKAIQILKSLDAGVHGGGLSTFTVGALDTMLVAACNQENITYDELIKHATWRN